MKRQSLLPRVYSVVGSEATLKKPFKPPSSFGYSDNKEQLTRRLSARKRFVPWGSNRPALVHITNRFSTPDTIENDPEESESLPPGIEPLVLWQPEEAKDQNNEFTFIIVDPLLVKFLRPHQRYCLAGFLVSMCEFKKSKIVKLKNKMFSLLRRGSKNAITYVMTSILPSIILQNSFGSASSNFILLNACLRCYKFKPAIYQFSIYTWFVFPVIILYQTNKLHHPIRINNLLTFHTIHGEGSFDFHLQRRCAVHV